MKRLVKSTLSILILCLLISGCADKLPPEHDPFECPEVQQYIECPAPAKPVYGEFSEEIHVGHLGNLEMMRENLEKALKYNDSLENTIDCYKKQTENGNESN